MFPPVSYTHLDVYKRQQLWMRDKLVEAIDIVPFGYADTLRGQAETEENEAYE